LLWLPGCETSAAKGRGHRRVASPETSGITGLVSGRTTPHGSGGNEATGKVAGQISRDVSVSQDRDKGVVTLGGHVAADGDKSQAESIARSIAGAQVVSNQIAVIPPGAESDAKTVNSDLDKAIESNLDAALIKEKLHESVKYAVKNHVVTLTGEVDSQSKRARAEKVASAILNVQQVVNELQVKRQKASSSK
jgi:osmotically-inducible protein OsmY